MEIKVSPFDTHFMDQLDKLPPPEWQSNAYDLFMYNDWQPWFHPYQVLDKHKLVGFGMIFHFADVAWLGWIIVDKRYRKLGIGTAIAQHLMLECKNMGVSKMVLTATELGVPVYEKLGFKTIDWYYFFSVPVAYQAKIDKTKIRPASKADFEAIVQLDNRATGEKREALLKNHLDAIYVYQRKNVEGFYVQNLGTGLIIAATPEAGEQLSSYRIKKNNNKIYVPGGNAAFIEELRSNGFTETAKIPRMVLGAPHHWNPEMIYNRAAGYCG
ncbi:MAG: GNAT family N-acetyltransferase [Prolixibacteraceae bacterium]